MTTKAVGLREADIGLLMPVPPSYGRDTGHQEVIADESQEGAENNAGLGEGGVLSPILFQQGTKDG
jgi:hypothetical protein